MSSTPTVSESINAKVVAEMRSWLSECEWSDVDGDDIATMSDERVIRAVQAHYVGGVVAFLLES